jgi:hypothetical protein
MDSFFGKNHFKYYSDKAKKTMKTLDEAVEGFEHTIVEGWTPQAPEVNVPGIGHLKFPIKKEDAEKLYKIAKDAPFGKGTETVMDKTVRNCRHFDASKQEFTIPSAEWNKLFSNSQESELLEDIREKLASNSTVIEAQLYKLLVYPPGGFFKPHVDTQREEKMFGTLVVELSCDKYDGGQLVIEPGHRFPPWDFRYEWKSKGSAPFIAFYADSSHEVETVRNGYKMSLVYNLVRAGTTTPIVKKEWSEKAIDLIEEVLKEETIARHKGIRTAKREEFSNYGYEDPDDSPYDDDIVQLPEGVEKPAKKGKGKKAAATSVEMEEVINAAEVELKEPVFVGKLMEHQYGLVSIKPENLKGKDAELYRAAVASGKFTVTLLPVDIEKSGVGGCGEESDSDLAEQMLGEEVRYEIYPLDPTAPKKGSKKHEQVPVLSKKPFHSSSYSILMID